MDKVARFVNREPVFLLVSFIALSMMADITGRGHGHMKKDYLTLNDLPDRAVVRVYSDKILAVQFDRVKKTILPSTMVRKIEKDNMLRLEKNLGPLSVPEKP